MKKIKNIVYAVVILMLGLQGCGKFLDVDIPDTMVKDDFWKSRDQLTAALMSVYTQLGNNITLFLEWGDMRSDIYAPNGNTTSDQKQMFNQSLTTSNALANWTEVYKGINWANSFLKNADKVLGFDQSVTPEEVAAMKAEVYTLRALFYFYLVRSFQDVPVVLEPYESSKQSPYGPAVKEEQVLDVIESDLALALADIPETFIDPVYQYGRITRNAVKALWADVKLWRGGEANYQGCISLCEELEAEYKGKMLTADTWFTLFSPGNTSESIFEYQYMQEKGPASPLRGLFKKDGTLRLNSVAFQKNIKKAYFSSTIGISDTVRYQRTIFFGSEVFKYTGIAFDKNGTFQFRDDVSGRKVHFIFYRYREILLMKAEALAMLDKFEAALVPVNTIRAATEIEQQTSAVYGRGKLFFDKLLAERVAELGYEGKQWYSMVRVARHTGYDDLLIDRIVETSMSGVKQQTLRARLQEKDGWFMPYLESEVTSNLDLVQKDFYKGKK